MSVGEGGGGGGGGDYYPNSAILSPVYCMF